MDQGQTMSKDKKHWLGNRIKRKPGKVNIEKQENTPYGVVFHPIRCPRCSTKNIKCYSSEDYGKRRYYKCNECEYRFKAVEAEQ